MELSKKEVIAALAEKFETTKVDAEDIYTGVFDTIEDLIISHREDIKLGNIGTLKVKEVAERTYALRDMKTNTVTGETKTIIENDKFQL